MSIVSYDFSGVYWTHSGDFAADTAVSSSFTFDVSTEEQPFTYVVTDFIEIGRGDDRIQKLEVISGEIVDSIQVDGFSSDFTVEDMYSSQLETLNGTYVLFEFLGRQDGQEAGVLAVVYGEGDLFEDITTAAQWYATGDLILSQDVVIKDGYRAGESLNVSDWGLDTSNSPLESELETGVYSLDVVVDLFGDQLLLKGLKEVVTSDSHTIEYNGSIFDYDEVDPIIQTVVRDGDFTAEFSKEIADQYPDAAGISYGTAVALIGVENIDATIRAVAAADGSYVS